ncbi:thioesterase domain-containing protein [Streptosporangium soli]|nr:thioesterase domain-containing protein [Streptosporangium sp. KLBMP 9127]
MTRSSWYLSFDPRPAARVHLYGLPFAGGGPSMFRPWSAHLPPWMELRALRLPGRQGRHHQPAFTDCEEAAAVLAGSLARESAATGVPYALFGHSMGALLSYRLTRALLRAGEPAPVLLALAAWPVRGATRACMPDPAAADDQFVAALSELGGLPPELAEDPAVLAMTLPVARADFVLCRSYAYRAEPPLPVPVLALGGTGDLAAPPAGMAEWHDHTEDFRGLRLYDGGHFFVRDHLPDLAAAIAGEVGRIVGIGAAGLEDVAIRKMHP